MCIIFIFLSISPRTDSLMLKALDLSYREEFDRANSLLQETIRIEPEHPAPYFCLASLYELMWVDLGCDFFVDSVDKYSELCVSKGNNMLKSNPEDGWVHFFIGGAYTLKVFYYALKGDIFMAIPFISPSLKSLTRARNINGEINDVLLGLGGWEYFKGHLPFMTSRKEKGLSMIKKASEKGKYVSMYASLAYAKILLRENKYEEAIDILIPMTDTIPDSRTFTWPLLKAYYGNKNYERALEVVNTLIAISGDNSYSLFESLYYKTLILKEMDRIFLSVESAEHALKVDVNKDAPRVPEMKEKLRCIINNIQNKLGE